MPSIAGHMVVAKLVGKNLKIDDPNFIRGNLLPDIIKIPNSHHKVLGSYYLIPDIDYFRKTLDLNNSLWLGYFVHLLLDKYFLEVFVPNNISDLDVFQKKIIYNEYNAINYQLVTRFDLDVEYLKKVLKSYNEDINQEKLEYNIDCLANTVVKSTKYLQFSAYADFLGEVSKKISGELDFYANKFSDMFIRSRK